MKKNQKNNFIHRLYSGGNYQFTFGNTSYATVSTVPKELFAYFDGLFLELAAQYNAEERAYPKSITKNVLQKAEYFRSFPKNAVSINNNMYANPACCFHVYHQLENQMLGEETQTITTMNTCSRHEKKYIPLERQREFTMREIIFVGSYSDVESRRKELLKKLLLLVKRLQLTGKFEKAADPFFISAHQNRGKLLLQKLKSLKFELCLSLDTNKTIAVSSFNLHEYFFGERFNITLPNKEFAATACIAFGIERWILAFLTQHGSDWHTWPTEVKKNL